MTTVSEGVRTAPPQPAEDPGFEELATRVDDAYRALAGLDGPARAVAEELKDAIEAVHRAGLVTIVRRMRGDDAARAALFELVDDPVVHLLFSLHGIVRPDPTTQATRALAGVRPQLQDHGGDVTLVRIDDGTAYVRLQGACNGCSMSSVTLRNLVEKALVEGVSTVTAVEVLPNEPAETLISVESLFGNRPAPGDGWARAGRADALPDGAVTPMTLTAGTAPAQVLVVNLGGTLSAYLNECAHEALPLDNAVLDTEAGTLTCPWHGFCYDATSGECLSAPGAQLEALPLRVDGGEVWIRVQT
ncbi:MAG: NifU family protein [Actinobacteria bacterium]|nr:NifU family protein [Actinomycetota bacterium]